MNNSELARLRELSALDVLRVLGDHVKVDKDFRPAQARSTQRIHVSAAGADWELLVDGPRFFDTGTSKGGGGAVDLVMHLWQVPFKKALAMLNRAGV